MGLPDYWQMGQKQLTSDNHAKKHYWLLTIGAPNLHPLTGTKLPEKVTLSSAILCTVCFFLSGVHPVGSTGNATYSLGHDKPSHLYFQVITRYCNWIIYTMLGLGKEDISNQN